MLFENFSINLSKILQELSDFCEIEKKLICLQSFKEIQSSEEFKNITQNLIQSDEMIQIFEVFLAQVNKIFSLLRYRHFYFIFCDLFLHLN